MERPKHEYRYVVGPLCTAFLFMFWANSSTCNRWLCTLGVYVHFATSTREFLKLKLSTWILLITSIQTVVLMMNNQQIPSP